MGKDKSNSVFDIDNDVEFNENFYSNIEKVLASSNIDVIHDAKKASYTAFNTTMNTTDNAMLAEEAEEGTEEAKGTKGIRAAEEAIEKEEVNEIEANELEAKAYGMNETDEAVRIAETAATADIGVFDFVSEDFGFVSSATDAEISQELIDEELSGIKASLAKQICDELEVIGTEKEKSQPKRAHRFMRIQNGLILTLLCLIGFGFFFGFTKPGNEMLMGMGINIGGKIWAAWTNDFDNTIDIADEDHLEEDDIASDAPEVDPKQIVWPEHPGRGRHEEGVYNILLLGEEAIGSGGARGRTDVIIVATLNTKHKTIRLTSLMRDMLVQIPGYKDNKLNTAYEKGGLDLMYETIALNFDLKLDGAVLVNFEKFEQIIDELGGLEITLTAGEAKYLNSTNYISKPQYRNVKAGTQVLNGNQVLGYSRVRKRATITGNNNDYGRTDRHRIILNAIFDKYKTHSKVELGAMMFKLLPMITTDIDSKHFEVLLNSFIEMGTMEMSQLRIPVDGAFDDNVKVRGMSVLIPDLDKNTEALHKFIFEADTDTTAKSN